MTSTASPAPSTTAPASSERCAPLAPVSPLADRFEGSALAACERQFPRTCSTCTTSMATFAAYLAATKVLGSPKLDTSDDEDEPLGMMCFANCKCGNTLAVVHEDVRDHRAFNHAVRSACATSGRTEAAVLSEFVYGIHARANADAPHATGAPMAPEGALLALGAALYKIVERKAVAIPAYPAVAFRVEELTRQQDASLDDIARTISGDPALVAAVMQLANSALHARGQAMVSVPQAVSRIGLKEIARIAITAGVGAATGRAGPLSALRNKLWHKCLTTAMLSRHLGEARGLRGDEAFLCGLLHHLGSIVAALSLETFLAEQPAFPAQTIDAWMQIVQHFRVEVGGLTAKQWRLPRVLSDAIAAHSGTDRATCASPEMINVVIAASAVERVAAKVTEVTVENLIDIVALRTLAERELIARVFPDCALSIAAFEAAAAKRPAPSKVAAAAAGPGGPAVSREILVVDTRHRDEAYRLVSASPRALVLVGKRPLQENVLACLEAAVEPRLQLWATTTSCAAVAGSFTVTLVPFACDAETHQRWLALVASLGCEADVVP